MGDSIPRVPPPVRAGEPVKAAEFNALREELLRLGRELVARTPQPSPELAWKRGSGGFTGHLRKGAGGTGGGVANFAHNWNHPYKIQVSRKNGVDKAEVLPGHASGSTMVTPAGYNPILQPVLDLISLAPMTLTVSEDVGFWVVAEYYVGSVGVNNHFQNLRFPAGWNFAVEARTDAVDPEDYLTVQNDALDDQSAEYIGAVKYEDGEWVVYQHLKSDVVFPAFAKGENWISADPNNLLSLGTDGLLLVDPEDIPNEIVSGDTGNSLKVSVVDGKLFVPPIVSADANNEISEGNDGGAFYDAP